MELLDKITNLVLAEVNRSVGAVAATVQRKILKIVLKAFFAVAGLASLAIGLIVLGSKYVGLDLMMLLVGVCFLLAFLLS
jgi:hypothetical protein